MKILRIVLIVALVPLLGWGWWASASKDATAPEIAFENDAAAILQSRQGLVGIVAYLEGEPTLFLPERQLTRRTLTRDEREQIWHTWQSFLDHVLALDSLGQAYSDFHALDNDDDKKRAFKLAFAAFLAQYRYALDFIRITENDPTLHVVMNEPVPELGLPAGSYSEIKFRFLNVIRGAEFARLSAIDSYYGASEDADLQAAIEDDQRAIWRAGGGSGPLLTAENGLQIVRDAGFTAWFPVQKGVSEWMGDVKVLRKNRSLISAEQIEAMGDQLEPGDILLERREWYLSNIGLPGFWPHAALYIGTPEQREAYFDDPAVRAWLATQPEDAGSLDALLKSRFAEAYALSLAEQPDGHRPRVLEAISEGVVFTTLEHSADADSVVVLRPRLSRAEKAMAIAQAFHYSGRPYDFNFDFLTDAELVCTELVSKAYEPRDGMTGLEFPMVKIVGRYATPANEIARQFDAQYGTDAQQFDFVLFLDGYERRGEAVDADVEAFRESWRRPKWHIVVQDTPLARY